MASRKHALHARFQEALPRIERHARVVFCSVKCQDTREDKVQEVRGLCWKWIRKLDKLGCAWWTFVSPLATFACKAVKSGRKVVGSIRIKDVMNEVNQARKGYCITKLPDISTESSNPLSDALIDNARSEIPEQVCFRIDFPAWRRRFCRRDRRLIDTLMQGHRTKDVARLFQVSEGRASQLRRAFMEDWDRFTADPREQ